MILSQDLRNLNLAGCWLTGGSSALKRSSCHWLLVYFPLPSLFFNRLTKVVCIFLFYFCFRCAWSISDFLIWYTVCFHKMSFPQILTVMTDSGKRMQNLALQRLKALYLHYHIACCHYIFPTVVCRVNKLGRMLTFLEHSI